MTPIQTQEMAWLTHYLHNAMQYVGLAGLALGAFQFWRKYREDKRAQLEALLIERETEIKWRVSVEERLKNLEKNE